MEKKKLPRIPMVEAHIKQVKKSAKDLKVLIEAYNEHANEIANAAFLMDDKDARRLEVEISVHNIRNAARSIKTYFDMMQMLCENMEEDVKTITKKRNEYADKVYAEYTDTLNNRKKNEDRIKEAERKAQSRAEQAA